jgi:hypothetical protein
VNYTDATLMFCFRQRVSLICAEKRKICREDQPPPNSNWANVRTWVCNRTIGRRVKISSPWSPLKWRHYNDRYVPLWTNLGATDGRRRSRDEGKVLYAFKKLGCQ